MTFETNGSDQKSCISNVAFNLKHCWQSYAVT